MEWTENQDVTELGRCCTEYKLRQCKKDKPQF